MFLVHEKLKSNSTAASVTANSVSTDVVTFVTIFSTLINIWRGDITKIKQSPWMLTTAHYTSEDTGGHCPPHAEPQASLTSAVERVRQEPIAHVAGAEVRAYGVVTHLPTHGSPNSSRQALVDI